MICAARQAPWLKQSSPTSATMVLELHVWGPAFSLPSIEAQCLAIIAYFTQVVPKDQWVLVASSDPSVSPTSKCPGSSRSCASALETVILMNACDDFYQMNCLLSGMAQPGSAGSGISSTTCVNTRTGNGIWTGR